MAQRVQSRSISKLEAGVAASANKRKCSRGRWKNRPPHRSRSDLSVAAAFTGVLEDTAPSARLAASFDNFVGGSPADAPPSLGSRRRPPAPVPRRTNEVADDNESGRYADTGLEGRV
jgi:hypothetical protein